MTRSHILWLLLSLSNGQRWRTGELEAENVGRKFIRAAAQRKRENAGSERRARLFWKTNERMT